MKPCDGIHYVESRSALDYGRTKVLRHNCYGRIEVPRYGRTKVLRYDCHTWLAQDRL
jgi:hypothetical protein